MRRSLVGALIVLFGFCALVWAQTDVILIDYGSKLFKPTEFKHAEHATAREIACKTCHHTEDQVKCSQCHQLTVAGDAPKAKDAFHKLCKTCHQQLQADGKEAPVSCTGCHEKK